LQHLQFPGSKPQLAEILVWGDSHRSSLSHFQNRYLLFDLASSWLGGKSIVKNPKNDTYSPCYDANACGLLASIFGCCTIVGLCFGWAAPHGRKCTKTPQTFCSIHPTTFI